MSAGITKLEAARRQLETAIDLWFEDRDGLSVFTLAFATLKVLMNLYPHRSEDSFGAELDSIIGVAGWKSMSSSANFLKHADKDPDAVLAAFHPDMGLSVIGLSVILYSRLAGKATLKMMAFDSWVERIGADEIGIPEIDQNMERVAAEKRMREALKHAPRELRMRYALEYYQLFLSNYERLRQEAEEAHGNGQSFQDVLDKVYEREAGPLPVGRRSPI